MNPDDVLGKALYKHRPHSVKLYKGTEDPRTVMPTARKKRWETLQAVIEKLQWDRLEMLDGRGSVLEVIEIDQGGEDDEPAELGAAAGRDERILSLLMRAVREARKDRNEESKEAMAGMVAVMREMTGAFRDLAEMHQMQIQQIKRTLQLAPAPAAGKKDDLEEAIELYKLLQPHLLDKAKGEDKPKSDEKKDPPKNGASS
jgi:hypothetical protein